MNLTTHSTYPDVSICGDSFKWVARLLNREGAVITHYTGKADSYDQARDQVSNAVSAVASDYLIEGK